MTKKDQIIPEMGNEHKRRKIERVIFLCTKELTTRPMTRRQKQALKIYKIFYDRNKYLQKTRQRNDVCIEIRMSKQASVRS